MSRFPRIAYLTALYPAVSHTFILREVEGLRALGFEISTASVRRPGAEHLRGSTEKAAADSTFYILEAAKRGLTIPTALIGALRHPRRLASALKLAMQTRQPGLKGTAYQVFYLAEAIVLARWLSQENIDHLHCHFAQSSAHVTMLAAALADIPFSYTLHGPADLYEPHRWHLPEKTARASFVACISHFARAQAMLFSDPAHWDKLRIVHCGVIPELYDQPPPEQAAPKQTTVDPSRLHLLFVGRLAPVKGLRVLLEALPEVLKAHPGVQLTIVGDGDDRARLEAAAKPLGDAVRFTGYMSQDEVAAILADSDVFVLPSFAEGLPVVLMEALAAGKSAIAPRVAGVAELIDDGKTGLLVHAGDKEGLTQALCTLAADPDRARQMGAAGRDVVCQEFDARTEAARIGALFLGTTGSQLRPPPLTPKTPSRDL